MLSKATPQALKSQKTYLDDSEWLCFWHRLSGDELKEQIYTVGHKPTDQLISFTFKDLSGAYKLEDMDGVKKLIAEKFGVSEVTPSAECAFNFLNDAKLEYTGKEYA